MKVLGHLRWFCRGRGLLGAEWRWGGSEVQGWNWKSSSTCRRPVGLTGSWGDSRALLGVCSRMGKARLLNPKSSQILQIRGSRLSPVSTSYSSTSSCSQFHHPESPVGPATLKTNKRIWPGTKKFVPWLPNDNFQLVQTSPDLEVSPPYTSKRSDPKRAGFLGRRGKLFEEGVNGSVSFQLLENLFCQGNRRKLLKKDFNCEVLSAFPVRKQGRSEHNG